MPPAIPNIKRIGLLRQPQSRGFTYIGLLMFIAIGGIGLAVVGKVWHTEAQREREKELLFIGEQFRQAIGSYYETTPSGIKQYPQSLEQLVHDDRFPMIKHHLRRIYRDPMTGEQEWGLEKQQDRIVGVYSLSKRKPLIIAGIRVDREAKDYRDWRFVYAPLQNANVASSSTPANMDSGNTLLSASQPTSLLPDTVPNTGSSNGQTSATQTSISTSSPATDNGTGGINQTIKDSGSQVNPALNDSVPDGENGSNCLSLRVGDTATCSFVCLEKGIDDSSCNLCWKSSQQRYGACTSGGDIPPLADGS